MVASSAAASPQPSLAPRFDASPDDPPGCKIARIYAGRANDGGWGTAHERSFAELAREAPSLDLSLIAEDVPDDDSAAFNRRVDRFVAQGAKAVFALAYHFGDGARAASARYPAVAVFQVGGVAARGDPPNLGHYAGYSEEARYIAGEVAGLTINPGANIGYVASAPLSEVFRGINSFALGVRKTNPAARVHVRWVGASLDAATETSVVASLAGFPVNAELLAQGQDSPAVQVAAQAARKWGISSNVDMTEAAPKATLTGPVWNWLAHNRPATNAVCNDAWLRDGRVVIPRPYVDWFGSMRDGTVSLAPLNTGILAEHPRRFEIGRVYNEELAAFRSGDKSFPTVFAAPVRDNTGAVRIRGRADLPKLFEENDLWLFENVVGTPRP